MVVVGHCVQEEVKSDEDSTGQQGRGRGSDTRCSGLLNRKRFYLYTCVIDMVQW